MTEINFLFYSISFCSFFFFQGSTHKHWNVVGHVEGVAWRREEVIEESEEDESDEEESEEESEEEEEEVMVAVTEQKKSRRKEKQMGGRSNNQNNKSQYYGVEINIKRFNARIWLNGKNKVKLFCFFLLTL